MEITIYSYYNCKFEHSYNVGARNEKLRIWVCDLLGIVLNESSILVKLICLNNPLGSGYLIHLGACLALTCNWWALRHIDMFWNFPYVGKILMKISSSKISWTCCDPKFPLFYCIPWHFATKIKTSNICWKCQHWPGASQSMLFFIRLALKYMEIIINQER